MTLCSLINSNQLSEEHVLFISRIVHLPGRNFSRPNYLPIDKASYPKILEYSISGYIKNISVPENCILIDNDSVVSLFSVIKMVTSEGATVEVNKTSPVRSGLVSAQVSWADVVGSIRTVV
jgi:hypothetical protein